MSAEHKRPLFAFGAVAALCTFLLLSAIVRGDALSVAFHSPVPISSPSEPPAAADAAVDAAPVARESVARLPRELTLRPLSRTPAPKSATSGTKGTRRKAGPDVGAVSATTLVESDRAQQESAVKAQRKADKAAAKTARKADKAAAKLQRETEKAADKVQRRAEKAADKVQRRAEKAAAKLQRETEKAAAKAQRAVEKAKRAAEHAASRAAGAHPGLGALKAAEHAHKR